MIFWLNKKLNKMADIKPNSGNLWSKIIQQKYKNVKNCPSENISVLWKPFSINMISGINAEIKLYFKNISISLYSSARITPPPLCVLGYRNLESLATTHSIIFIFISFERGKNTHEGIYIYIYLFDLFAFYIGKKHTPILQNNCSEKCQ